MIGTPIFEGTPDGSDLEHLCGSPDHQGVCADAGEYPYADAGSLLDDEQALVVVLDEVQDPRNLGAVARVAETAGAAGLVIHERGAAQGGQTSSSAFSKLFDAHATG